jgi:hypothetical protein
MATVTSNHMGIAGACRVNFANPRADHLAKPIKITASEHSPRRAGRPVHPSDNNLPSRASAVRNSMTARVKRMFPRGVVSKSK